MIRDFLAQELRARLPEQSFTERMPPDAIVSFPAAHPDVGDLNIYDDGEEARVEITGLTHGHFGCWNENFTKTEKEKEIVEGVVDFTAKVFSHQVVFFCSLNGRVGGWQILSDNIHFERNSSKRYFTWCGPEL